jgi:hypothetical protein
MVVEAEITYATRSQSPVKRFFLVSYFYYGEDGRGVVGNINLWTNGVFPSISDIDGYIKHENAVIITIFEFNNESDYNQFIG